MDNPYDKGETVRTVLNVGHLLLKLHQAALSSDLVLLTHLSRVQNSKYDSLIEKLRS